MTFCVPSSLNEQLPPNNAASTSCSQQKNWVTIPPPNSCDDCSSYLGMQPDPTLTTRPSGNSSYNGFQMVLASSGDMPLEALATPADKVMEVASPSVSSVNVAPLTSEVGQLRSEVAQLREMIAALKIVPSNPHHWARSRSQSSLAANPVPAVLLHSQQITPHLPASAGITAGMVTPPASAPPPVCGRETARPGVDGDQHLRPITESPVLCYRPDEWSVPLGGHRS